MLILLCPSLALTVFISVPLAVILEARKPEIIKLVGNDGYNELVAKKMSAFGVATIKALAESGNIEGANDALNKHGKAMTPAAVAESRSIITNKKGTFDVFATIDAMKDDPSLKNPDGSPNFEKGLAVIKAKYGINAGAGNGATGVIAAAEKMLGVAYGPLREGGGNGTTTTDCGEFIQRTWKSLGLPMSVRTVDDMYANAEQGKDGLTVINDKSQLKPGDLVFYKNTSYQADEAYKRITHAGIYAGKTRRPRCRRKEKSPNQLVRTC